MEKTHLKNNLQIKKPKVKNNVFVARGAQIIGDVILDEYSSIWYNTVLRGDINNIVIGKRSNIQDNSVVHLENDKGVIVGNDVTVGHGVILHGCRFIDGAFIGMGAIIMNSVVIGKGVVVGAGTLIKEGSVIPPYSLVVGVPGKIVKTYSNKVLQQNIKWARKYVELAKVHIEQGFHQHTL